MGRRSAKRATWGQWAVRLLAVATLGGCAAEAPDASEADDTAQAEQALAAASAADAATARRVQPVAPVLKCIDVVSSKQLRAHFGYTNSAASAIAIPVGPFNQFVPGPAGRGQPTNFARGVVADAVQVTFASSGAQSWVLGTHVAIATRQSPRCPMGGMGGSGAGGAPGAGGTPGTGGARMCPSSCDDLNPCTADSCGADTNFDCAHAPIADGTSCSDGNACTSGDACQAGQCAAGTPTTCPPATDQCRVAVCDPASGACTTVAAPNGTTCSNGHFCTVNEICSDGVCAGGSERVCPANDNPCEIPHCFPEDGMGFGGFCFFNPPTPPALMACRTFDGQPGICNPQFIPSFCTAISCDSCSDNPFVRPFPGFFGPACPAACADTLCQDLYSCLVATSHAGSSVPGSCLAPDGSASACWCGTNPCTCATDSAPATAANGPCRSQVIAAAGTSDPAAVQQQLSDPSSTVGHAFALAQCRAQNCAFFCSFDVPATAPPGTVCAQPASAMICLDAEHC